MKKLGLLSIVFFAVCFSIKAITTEKKESVYFETANSQLTKAAEVKLNNLIQDAAFLNDFELFIEGHTDSRGTNNYNEHLSFERSETVKAYFLSKGILAKYVTIDFKGESTPFLPNTNSKNMESNRRVEVYLKSYEFESLTELEAELNRNNETSVEIDPNIKNLINGINGVQVYIPLGSFVNKNGEPVQETVTVKLVESLSIKDFIASGLQTKANNQLLESGGMIQLSATTSSGEEVEISEGKKLIVAIPNENRQNGMEVFLSDSGSNWTNTGRPITNSIQPFKANEFPVLQSDQTPFPKFNYSVPQPPKPKAPKKVRVPHKPKEASYTRRIPWYKLNKEELRAKQQENYQKAMSSYAKKAEKYKKRIKTYQYALETYHENSKYYDLEMAQWNAKRLEAKEIFNETPEYQAVLNIRIRKNKQNKEIFDKEVAAWRAARRNYAAAWGEGMDAMGMTSERDLKTYIFEVSNLKWINVDKLMESETSENQMVLIETKDVTDERVHIVFKEIQSMITCRAVKEGNRFEAHNIPKKAKAYIFAYKIVDCKPQMCFMEMNGNENYKLAFIETSFVEIKEVLSQLEQS